MNLAALAFRPHEFFARHADSLGWTWPLIGFYAFAFASYFQSYLGPGYRMPYWLVVYIVAWAPAVLLAAGLFVLLVLLWVWPASKVLGRGRSLARCTQLVGASLLIPAGAFLTVLVVLAILDGNEWLAAKRATVRAIHGLAGLWALVSVTAAAAVVDGLGPRRIGLLALWFVVLASLVGTVLT